MLGRANLNQEGKIYSEYGAGISAEAKVVEKPGGPGGVRTLDLMTASHARSQLRHRPKPMILPILHYSRGAGKAGSSVFCNI